MIYQIKKIINSIFKMIKSRTLLLNLKHFVFRIFFRTNSYNYAFKEYTIDITKSKLIKNYFESLNNDGFLIHIGICDYEKDFFKPYFEKKNFRGLLLEANPLFIDDIKKNLNPNFKVINILVDDNEKSKFLYHVETKSLNKYPEYVKGICSVNKKNLIQHHIKEKDIRKIEVESKKLSRIIKEENISKIDFLIIDVEGLEFNILQDFLKNTNFKANIIFEMKFMKKVEIFEILDLLKKNEYDITLFKNDFICLKKN